MHGQAVIGEQMVKQGSHYTREHWQIEGAEQSLLEEKGGTIERKQYSREGERPDQDARKQYNLQRRCVWMVSVIEGRIGSIGKGGGIGDRRVETLPVGIEKRVPRCFERRRI